MVQTILPDSQVPLTVYSENPIQFLSILSLQMKLNNWICGVDLRQIILTASKNF